jgi:hypothetical protein
MLQSLNGPAEYGALSVGSVTPIEVKVQATYLDDRKLITIQPLNGDVYYGYTNAVTISTGTKIFSQQFFPLETGFDLKIWLISVSGTVDVRITEVA